MKKYIFPLLILSCLVGKAHAQQTVNIDDAWLTANGPSPYVLIQPNTTYILAKDIVAPRTAFVVGAANIKLDLGGHSVTYGDTEPLVIPNSGSEDSPDSLP